MRRAFVANLALVLVLNLLVKPFYILGIDAEVQARAGTAAYGTYAALLSLSFLLNIVLDLGITNWNTRRIAQDPSRMRHDAGGLLSLRGLLALGYGVVLFVVAWVLGYRGTELQLLAILALNQALAALVLYLRSNIAGAQRYAQDSLLSVLDRVLLIGLMAWLLWGRGAHAAVPITWFAWAQTAAYGATAVVAFARVAAHGGMPALRWDPPFFRAVLRECYPYALLVLLMTFYYRTDTVMLERLLPDGATQAGIYAQGFRFFEALNMLGFLLAGLLLPMFTRLLAQRADVGPLVGTATRLVLVGALCAAVIGTWYARPLMDLRYAEHTDASAPAFAVMVWSFLAVCITYVFGTLLTAAGDLRTLNRMAAAGMVLNIALNLVLIPRYQTLGAAWAGLITQGATALAQVLIAARRFQLRPRTAHVLGALAFAALLVALGAWTRSAALGLFAGAVVVCMAAVVLAALTGLLPWRAAWGLVRERVGG